ncbi:MAG TPA: S-layer protein domain-containing protein [Methanosarcina barkeri]|jgi:hypothetical protein|nr:S-layer protein domain-containing protein [Methanosarcina barkeri]
MHVPDKHGRKEDKEINLIPVFSFFLLISLFFSVVFYSMSPALAADNNEKLSIVLINGEEIYVRSGNFNTLLQDYQLYVKGTDTEGKRVWIELSRKGVPLQDAIVTEGSQFVYLQNSTEVLNLTVDTVYIGADGVLVRFSPVYQYLDPRLPMPQTPIESITNSSNNSSSDFPGLETQAEGFDMPLFLLVLGTVLLVTGFFAGKAKKK